MKRSAGSKSALPATRRRLGGVEKDDEMPWPDKKSLKRRGETDEGDTEETVEQETVDAIPPTSDEEWEDTSDYEDTSDDEDEDDQTIEEEIIDDGAEDGEEDEDEDEDDDDDDDDDYADFQRETVALSEDMRRVTFDEEAETQFGTKTGKHNDENQDTTDAPLSVWRSDQQTQSLPEDGKLVYSNKAYDSFFQLETEYPCLSFDIVRDAVPTTRYPLSLTLVCGSQAEESTLNKLYILRVSNVSRTKHDVESEEDSEESYIGDDDESENDDDYNRNDEDDETAVGNNNNNNHHHNNNTKNTTTNNYNKKQHGEEVNKGEAIVRHRTISHYGTANRVRCAPHNTNLVAVWSDAGHVQLFDISSDLAALGMPQPGTRLVPLHRPQTQQPKSRSSLLFCTPGTSHSVEGYGLDWSAVSPGTFASGDCAGGLFVWQPSDDGRWRTAASSTPTRGPQESECKSIEEIQWSPTQAHVLIATRAGGAAQVWDTRDMRRSQITWQADPTDINVANWNGARQASHLLVTGAESGAVSVWDLRRLSGNGGAAPIQRLPWHRGSITSVGFSPHNESVLAVTGDDGQCTLWDLSLERDPSEEKEVIGELFGRPDLSGIPDQLMFQHQGLEHAKEAHWHPQIPGMVVTTDFRGLHLFRPMNWRSLMK